jgi:hypothetical protein
MELDRSYPILPPVRVFASCEREPGDGVPGWAEPGVEATLMLIWLSSHRAMFTPSMSVYLIADSVGYHGRLRVNTDATRSETPYREATMKREPCRSTST